MSEGKAFETIQILKRSGKPRDKGITMVIDWGFGLREQKEDH